MKAYTNVLNDVICLSEINKIKILYYSGTDYSNNWLHYLYVTYKNGTEETYCTKDLQKAKQDYENLKSALLEIEIDHPTEKGGAE